MVGLDIPKKMWAAYVSGGKIERRQVNTPSIEKGEALVKVELSGICATDLQLIQGYKNFQGIPGHEFVGTVIQCQNKKFQNKKVVGEINLGCQKCTFCQQGLNRHCSQRKVVGILHWPGSHAEYLAIPESNLYLVPEKVSSLQAVFTEPLAAACEIIEQVHFRPHDRVAIIGDGKLGNLIGQVLRLSGSEVHLFGRHSHKVAFLQQQGIICHLDSPNNFHQAFDIVVECTGNETGIKNALKIVKSRGTVVLKSTYSSEQSFSFNEIVVREITVIGSRCGNFTAALHLLSQKLVTTSHLLEKIVPFSQVIEAYDIAAQRGIQKLILQMNL